MSEKLGINRENAVASMIKNIGGAVVIKALDMISAEGNGSFEYPLSAHEPLDNWGEL